MRTIYITANNTSLLSGIGTEESPYNSTVLSMPSILQQVRPGDSICFGPGTYTLHSQTNIGFEVPTGVSISGVGRDTVLVFTTTNHVDHFIGFRHTPSSDTEDVATSFSGMVMQMPTTANITTAIQAFGDQVEIIGVHVIEARGHNFVPLTAGEAAIGEGFPLFASNRIVGAAGYRVNARGCSVIDSTVDFADLGYPIYASAITCDAACNGIVSSCISRGNVHCAFNGAAEFKLCSAYGANNFWYHDTYNVRGVKISECSAYGVKVFFKSISPDGVSDVILLKNVAKGQPVHPVYFVYTEVGSNLLIEDNELSFPLNSSGGFLGANITKCSNYCFRDNLVVTDLASRYVQDINTFGALRQWRSIGNRVRLPTEFKYMYSDTL